jgi:U3 small nucleolar ribonucleoprotein component
MSTEEKLADARAAAKASSNAKDKYLATYRPKQRKLRAKIDALAAELVAEKAVAEMSEAEQQAVAAQLTKVGDA